MLCWPLPSPRYPDTASSHEPDLAVAGVSNRMRDAKQARQFPGLEASAASLQPAGSRSPCPNACSIEFFLVLASLLDRTPRVPQQQHSSSRAYSFSPVSSSSVSSVPCEIFSVSLFPIVRRTARGAIEEVIVAWSSPTHTLLICREDNGCWVLAYIVGPALSFPLDAQIRFSP